MDKSVLKRLIIQSQEREINLVERDIDINFRGKINSIIGPRRAGKTFLIYQLIQRLKKKGLKDRILYINFEDERIWPVDRQNLSLILDAYYELYPENKGKKIYLFFDEIQVVPSWQKFVRRLYEQGDFEITLTGFSSKLLSKEIATELRGRAISYYVFPFSFFEFLKSKGVKFEKNFEFKDVVFRIRKFLEEYVEFGGFPEVSVEDEQFKIKVLQSYYELIFYKDIVERYKIRNYNALKELMHYLLANTSCLFSVNKYFKFLKSKGSKISKDALSEYVSYLSDVNFVFLIPKFSYSLKEQMMNPKKIYSIDNGLINAVSFKFSKNNGKLYENIVFLELKRRNSTNPLSNIYYWKGKNECDFIIKERDKITQAIQVTYNLNEENKQREVKGLIEALEEFNLKQGLVITGDYEAVEEVKNKKIKFIPLWKWLLEVNN